MTIRRDERNLSWDAGRTVVFLVGALWLALTGGSALASGDGDPVRESFLYAVAIDSGEPARPDLLTVVGAAPDRPEEYGRILNVESLPEVGDNVHHYGYSLDQERLLIPGLFSDRFHVFDVATDPRDPELTHVNQRFRQDSGYVAPHTVSPLEDGTALVSALGADTPSSGPGGLVLIDDETGEFVRHFGPGPNREPAELGPQYMYDIALDASGERLVTTTWGFPDDVLVSPYAPNGDTVAVWDVADEQVVQLVDLGEGSGATEADWFHEPGTPYGYTIGTGGGAWLWEDEDGNARLDFHQVLSEMALPCDMTLSRDDRFLYIAEWGADAVKQYDVRDPYRPQLVGEATVPHPCMMRLSRDGERLYVTNSVVGTLDDDPEFGARNEAYGIYLLEVDAEEGGLTHVSEDGSAWVDFTDVPKAEGSGPAGPHMILFDPGVPIEAGHH